MNKFLITGGNFTNKGAQAMLLITISEIRTRYPDAEIWVKPLDDYKMYDERRLRFHILRDHPDLLLINGKIGRYAYLYLKNFARFILKKQYIFKLLHEYPSIMSKLDCVVDISGFCLSSQFNLEYNHQLLNTIEEARKYSVPVVLMPQSFGPFNYPEDLHFVDKISQDLQYAKIIYAREDEGYSLLINNLGLKNIVRSYDLVLQNKSYNLSYAFSQLPEIKTFASINDDAVAVIPNMMNSSRMSQNQTVDMYKTIIDTLLRLNRKVYILYHSNMDRQVCINIYEKYSEDISGDVVLIDEELNCYEYEELTRHFVYVVASRYHSIVHSYKNEIPALIFGWAEKYHELARLMDQEQLVVDVRSNIDAGIIIGAVENIDQNHESYKMKIAKKLPEIQEKSCFEFLDGMN